MVDLDSEPTKIVEIGKQLLITRGALTTFSLTNDVAKYFAIIPAMFAGAHPGLTSQPGSATRPSNTGVAPNPHAALLETPSPVGRDGAAADTRARPGPRRTRHRRGLEPRHMGADDRARGLRSRLGRPPQGPHPRRRLCPPPEQHTRGHRLPHGPRAPTRAPRPRLRHRPCTDIAARGHTASRPLPANRPGRLLAWTAGFRLEREYVHYVTGKSRAARPPHRIGGTSGARRAGGVDPAGGGLTGGWAGGGVRGAWRSAGRGADPGPGGPCRGRGSSAPSAVSASMRASGAP